MPSKDSPVFVVTVSGSDASGAAGMQADNRAIHAMGAFPLNVVTALTLQTHQGVQSIDFSPPELVRMHLLGLLKEYPVQVIKAGMLGNAGIVRVLVEVLHQFPTIKLVLDPVVHATSGRPLLDKDGLTVLKSELLPATYLLTPNLPELALLSDLETIESREEEAVAVDGLLELGCEAVLVKGGHRTGESAEDRLYTSDRVSNFILPRLETSNTRGTGCALASLIAAGLSRDFKLKDAVRNAKERLHRTLQENQKSFWPGNGPAFPR